MAESDSKSAIHKRLYLRHGLKDSQGKQFTDCCKERQNDECDRDCALSFDAEAAMRGTPCGLETLSARPLVNSTTVRVTAKFSRPRPCFVLIAPTDAHNRAQRPLHRLVSVVGWPIALPVAMPPCKFRHVRSVLLRGRNALPAWQNSLSVKLGGSRTVAASGDR
jgi:hypothetical protein